MQLTVQQFLDQLGQAEAVSIDEGPLLTSWETASIAGEAANEVVRFSWTDGDYDYSYALTEEAIQQGVINEHGVFICAEITEYDTSIRMYSLIPLPWHQ